MQEYNITHKVDRERSVGFAPSKEQKGLCGETWKNCLPEEGATIVDLGCGGNKLLAPRRGDIVIGVDHTYNDVIDVLCNLDTGLCLKDDSVDAVFTQHC